VAGEVKVLDVRDGLVEELADVVVVEGVDDVASFAVPGYEAEVPQQTKLMRDGRGLHPHRGGQI
jgi:hypothetical protein